MHKQGLSYLGQKISMEGPLAISGTKSPSGNPSFSLLWRITSPCAQEACVQTVSHSENLGGTSIYHLCDFNNLCAHLKIKANL